MAAKPGDVDEYLAALAPATREVVEEMRRRVHAVAPGAEERISYDIPTFAVDGRPLVHIAGWAKHVSIYPEPEDPGLQAELGPYRSGRGTVKFPLRQPVPWELVDRVLGQLVAERATQDAAR